MYIPRLHPDTIDEVKQRADIYDVVSEYVVLRKRGKDYVGLCPFHSEKTPSFTVSQTKQMYYCFGCQLGGNAIKFLMDLEKHSFAEVVLDLARRYQVPVKTIEPEQRHELQRQVSLREQLYEVLSVAAQFYQHALQHYGNKAMQYLQTQRHLTEDTIRHFGLGYAPAGWETLYRYLVEDKRYPAQLVEQAGLIKPRKETGGHYDVFRDRIMIPIYDVLGRVIGFGGRTLGDEQPKYLNSPETEVFLKRKTLFALDKAKTAIGKQDQVVVVEGYFDAIALHAVGLTHSVASLGTALSIEQVRQMLRYTDSNELVLNFDADAAGINAAERAIGEIAELAYKGEVQLKILNLPDGKDADEYLQTHPIEDYKQLLTTAPLWIDWQIQQILKERNLKQAADFQYVSQQIVKLLKKLVNPDTLNYYVSHCAEILSLGDARLIPLRVENLITQIAPSTAHRKPFPSQIKKTSDARYGAESTTLELPTTERSLIQEAETLLLLIYLYYPEHRQTIMDTLEERDLQFSLSHHRFLWQQILVASQNMGLTGELVSLLQDRCLEFPEQMQMISHLFHLKEKTQKDIFRAPLVLQAATATIELVLCEKRYRQFRELWEQIDPEIEPEKWEFYYQAFYDEKIRMQELERLRLFSLPNLLD